jgi:hypothetical protein
MLLTIMRAQLPQATSHALRRVRVVGFDSYYEGEQGTEVMDLLAQLADGSYVGLDSSGLSGTEPVPVLDGKLTINASVYLDSVESLRAYFKHLVINITGEYYIRFADPEVLRVLLANNVGDSVGITKENAEKVTSFGRWFHENTEIQHFDELVLFKNVRTLESNAFGGTTNLISIDLSNIREIGMSGFYDSGVAGELNTPNLTKLGNFVFTNCINLKKIDLSHVTSWGGQIFQGCTSLEDVGSIEHIEGTILGGMFKNCSNLAIDVYLPKITKLDNSAFEFSGIKSINAPRVESIGRYVFGSCLQLTGDLNFPLLQTMGDSAFVKTSITSFVAESLTSAGSDCFNSCPNLESVVMPKVISLGNRFFWHSSNLKEVNLDGIETLQNVFSGCVSLRKMRLPSIITLNGAFDTPNEDRYELIDLGENLTSIANNSLRGGFGMKAIIIRAKTPPEAGTNICSSSNNCPIYVPDESVEAYKTATGFTSYATRIKPLSEYEG